MIAHGCQAVHSPRPVATRLAGDGERHGRRRCRIRLFDPQAAHGLVLARRPPSRSAVAASSPTSCGTRSSSSCGGRRRAPAGRRTWTPGAGGGWPPGAPICCAGCPRSATSSRSRGRPVGPAEDAGGQRRGAGRAGRRAAVAPAALRRARCPSPSWRSEIDALGRRGDQRPGRDLAVDRAPDGVTSTPAGPSGAALAAAAALVARAGHPADAAPRAEALPGGRRSTSCAGTPPASRRRRRCSS